MVSPESLQLFLALSFGFAFAGLLASAYQLITEQPLGFGLLQHGSRLFAVAAVPFLAFTAPFIIMRNTLRGRRIERRRFEFVMVATIVAGCWSMLSGTVVVMALQTIAQY
ncbi:MAG TPA: hypothetical protein VFB45_21135 [Pseudolabrys sp.]|nr:hypothetical protein [Pseudolabrys sp.]